MAWITCPWCRTPQQVADEANEYRCFGCSGDVMIYRCPECSFVQTVNKRWEKFICGKCQQVLDLPRRWSYSREATARFVEGSGISWPRL